MIRLTSLPLVALLFVGTACDSLTDITSVGVVQPSSVASSQGAVAQYAGAVKHFVTASLNAVEFSGLFADEWITTDSPGNSVGGYIDARRPGTVAFQTGGLLFTGYSQALIALRFASNGLQQFAPTRRANIGQVLAYQGYLELFLAEHFCSGVPFSTIDYDGTVRYGAATDVVATYNRAIAHFDSAATFATDSARVLDLARVGKARALLGLGRYPAAAAAVNGVPTSFVHHLDISGSIAGQTNQMYNSILLSFRGVPAASEGGGIDFVGARDPRVPTRGPITGLDGLGTRIYEYSNYNSLAAPVLIANGAEARLIEAEAALAGNNNDSAPTGNGWLGILNALRSGSAFAGQLPPLADPGSYPARVDLLFRERAFWTFLTGHRMGDLRRLVRQYNRQADAVFPHGPYRDGVPYGSEVNLIPPPIGEGPNTLYTGCIDRRA
ncbi:MAG: hypothetical protein H7066_17300 [Cytophagaceae bacterium]|nr:hypothetical protein [Gemmatimonadaceae bacterium]